MMSDFGYSQTSAWYNNAKRLSIKTIRRPSKAKALNEKKDMSSCKFLWLPMIPYHNGAPGEVTYNSRRYLMLSHGYDKTSWIDQTIIMHGVV